METTQNTHMYFKIVWIYGSIQSADIFDYYNKVELLLHDAIDLINVHRRKIKPIFKFVEFKQIYAS